MKNLVIYIDSTLGLDGRVSYAYAISNTEKVFRCGVAKFTAEELKSKYRNNEIKIIYTIYEAFRSIVDFAQYIRYNGDFDVTIILSDNLLFKSEYLLLILDKLKTFLERHYKNIHYRCVKAKLDLEVERNLFSLARFSTRIGTFKNAYIGPTIIIQEVGNAFKDELE